MTKNGIVKIIQRIHTYIRNITAKLFNKIALRILLLIDNFYVWYAIFQQQKIQLALYIIFLIVKIVEINIKFFFVKWMYIKKKCAIW